MKLSLLTLSFFTFLLTTANAQTNLYGPGLENDEPPTAAAERQEDRVGGPQSLGSEDSRGTEVRPKTKINPQNEKGSKGKQAQEEARTKEFDMSKKEIQRKQKGE